MGDIIFIAAMTAIFLLNAWLFVRVRKPSEEYTEMAFFLAVCLGPLVWAMTPWCNKGVAFERRVGGENNEKT